MVNYGVHWQNNSTSLCVIGGILIGVIASSRMFLFGKVTGISGFVKTFISIDPKATLTSRILSICFVGGLVCGGAIANHYISGAFESWENLPMERTVIGGILVGFGTAHGNGCTSGHGICGISNLRLRSLVATCCFMLSAMITAMATDTQRYFPFFTNTIDINKGGAIIGVCIAVCFCLVSFGIILKRLTPLEGLQDNLLVVGFKLLADTIFGICFGLSMAVTNMSKPSAVLSFLDLRYWNPALAFIMGAGITVTATSFYFTYKREAPILDLKFDLSKIVEVDKTLVFGATTFGVGWGLVGVCPGPGIVNLGAENKYATIFFFSVVFGMLTQMFGVKYIFPPKPTTNPPISPTPTKQETNLDKIEAPEKEKFLQN